MTLHRTNKKNKAPRMLQLGLRLHARMHADLHAELLATAAREGRSLNAEIVHRLEESMSRERLFDTVRRAIRAELGNR